MSRSWERMVEKNQKQINARRKKEGKGRISAPAQQVDRFKGRSYIVPILLILLMVFFVTVSQPWQEDFGQNQSLFWITVGCYFLLAIFYYLRRPYLSVSKDTLETRRFSGYKRLKPAEIRKIVVQPGYVTIETVKGTNWVFSRFMNLYPIEAMGERLEAFATVNHIEWEKKSK
ncbi:hypothetical protein [Cohnella thailandensis]|jgi:hypothetical protein|uniref:Methyltransferase n=1 Tax=Cohnella thailandensis TaxID=557557 RepID=A0A841T5V9_9BACL|nr:hypothetical protein [Cohnella thailandensis]MBB6638339.1 hypothetical protein [Cohnella thailandensis]MBP1977183.1 hypothetical protein [Cohnella thailandensis]